MAKKKFYKGVVNKYVKFRFKDVTYNDGDTFKTDDVKIYNHLINTKKII